MSSVRISRERLLRRFGRIAAIACLTVPLMVLADAAAGEPGSGTVVAFQDAGAGEATYQATCTSCHQAGGVGVAGAFPPLAGNERAADAGYVRSVITDGLSGPIEVDGVTYDAAMPAVSLSDTDLDNVVAYVVSLAGAAPTPTPTTVVAAPVEADADRGRRLFEGRTGFAEGGVACQACHSAGDLDFDGGQGLGPDLSDVFTRFGGTAGMSAWLQNPGTPTMQALFADHPFTEDEIADMTAFLGTLDQEQPSGGVDTVLIGALVGFGLLLALMAFVVRGPQETYTQRLRRQA